MRKFVGILLVLLTISYIANFGTPTAKADSKIIIVPDDFPSISMAIRNATTGDTIYVKGGTYTETQLRINKSVTLIGENSGSTTLNLLSTRHVGEPLYWYLPDLFPAPVSYDTAMRVHADNFVLIGFTIVTNGGDINITGNNNKIKENVLSRYTSVIGSNNELIRNSINAPLTVRGDYCIITDNKFSENPSAQRLYDFDITGNHGNFSLNSINGGDASFTGAYGVISFNNITGSLSSTSTDCFFYKNTFSNGGEFRVNGKNNIICKNLLNHCSSGLVIIGHGNKALLNNITNCRIGISPSPDSSIYANYIANNEWTINSRNAIINPYGNLSFLTHNNFVDNRYYQMWTMAMSNDTDYLDNGKEGNYWNTYQGEDGNNDGIGDSSFYLDTTHLDRYPLINPFNLSTVEELFPDWLIVPTVRVVSPESTTYSVRNLTVDYILNKGVSWIGYSLDGMKNETITGNFTLTDLPSGAHNIRLYVIDEYGNQGISQIIDFNIEEPALFLKASPVIIIIISVVVCIVGLILYRRRARF